MTAASGLDAAPSARSLLLCATSLAGRSPPARVWHWPDWIPGRTVTLLTSDGGGGKTTLALQLAAATVTETAWLGQTPRLGPVLYLSAEDDLDELHRRLDEVCVGLGIGLDALDGLHLWPLADQDAVMAVEGRDGSIVTTERWDELLAMVKEIRPALVILDSLADVFGGNENIRAQVRQFVALLRRIAMMTGGAVLVLAHPSLAGMSTGSGSSGSTAWNNSVRSRIYLTHPDEPDNDPDARILSLKKANYTRAQGDMRLRREAGGFVLESGGGGGSRLDVAVERRRIDALFLQLVDAYAVQGRHVSDQPSPSYAPALFAKDSLAKGCTKAGFTSAMNRLLHADELRIEITGPASRQRRRLVRAGAEGTLL